MSDDLIANLVDVVTDCVEGRVDTDGMTAAFRELLTAASITAEDIQAAERAWAESQRSPSSNFRWRFSGGRTAFVADWLNARRSPT